MPNYPHLLFDFRHRSLEVLLRDGPAIGTVEFDEAHLVDIDDQDRAISVEILSLDDLRLDELADEFGFLDHLPAIRAALDRASNPPTRGTAVKFAEMKVIPGAPSGDAVPEAETNDSSEGPQVRPVIV